MTDSHITVGLHNVCVNIANIFPLDPISKIHVGIILKCQKLSPLSSLRSSFHHAAKAFGGFSKSQMALVVVAAAFPAAASRDMSVLRHVTLISFLSLAFMASLVVSWWPEKRPRVPVDYVDCLVEEQSLLLGGFKYLSCLDMFR